MREHEMRGFAFVGSVLAILSGIAAAAPKPTPTPDVSSRVRTYEAAHPGVRRVEGAVTEPRELSRVKPVYPKAAREKKRVLSPIILWAVITDTGAVKDPTVISSAHPDLDPAVLEAVRQWRYEPARINGKPVAVFLTVTVTF